MKVGNNIRKVLYSGTDDIKNSLVLFDSLSRSIFLIGGRGLLLSLVWSRNLNLLFMVKTWNKSVCNKNVGDFFTKNIFGCGFQEPVLQ